MCERASHMRQVHGTLATSAPVACSSVLSNGHKVYWFTCLSTVIICSKCMLSCTCDWLSNTEFISQEVKCFWTFSYRCRNFNKYILYFIVKSNKTRFLENFLIPEKRGCNSVCDVFFILFLVSILSALLRLIES